MNVCIHISGTICFNFTEFYFRLLTGTLKLNQHNTATLTVLLTGTLKLN